MEQPTYNATLLEIKVKGTVPSNQIHQIAEQDIPVTCPRGSLVAAKEALGLLLFAAKLEEGTLVITEKLMSSHT